MDFEWDEAKHAKTLRERDLGFDDGAQIFEGRAVIRQDDRGDYGEERFRSVRQSNQKGTIPRLSLG